MMREVPGAKVHGGGAAERDVCLKAQQQARVRGEEGQGTGQSRMQGGEYVVQQLPQWQFDPLLCNRLVAGLHSYISHEDAEQLLGFPIPAQSFKLSYTCHITFHLAAGSPQPAGHSIPCQPGFCMILRRSDTHFTLFQGLQANMELLKWDTSRLLKLTGNIHHPCGQWAGMEGPVRIQLEVAFKDKSMEAGQVGHVQVQRQQPNKRRPAGSRCGQRGVAMELHVCERDTGNTLAGSSERQPQAPCAKRARTMITAVGCGRQVGAAGREVHGQGDAATCASPHLLSKLQGSNMVSLLDRQRSWAVR